jgi:hypothetical protein
MKPLTRYGVLFLAVHLLVFGSLTTLADPLGTIFTYQGRFAESGVAYNGSAEFQATLWDASSGGTQVGTNSPTAVIVTVSNGLFVLPLDFGVAPFENSQERWLNLEVRTAIGPFTALSPRQRLAPAPYSLTAGRLSGPLPAGQLSGAIVSGNLAGTYANAVTLNNPGNTFVGDGAGITGLDANNLATGTVPDSRLSANVARANQVWRLTGNVGTTPGTDFLGTTDNQPLELRVNGKRALRLEDNGDGSDADSLSDGAPNVVGGSLANTVEAGVVGATISGGGATNYDGLVSVNSVSADYGSVGGGYANRVDPSATGGSIAGGYNNRIRTNSLFGFIGGGAGNRLASDSGYTAIAGGCSNRISAGSVYSVIGGGHENFIFDSSPYVTVAGGSYNVIGTNCDYSAVGGGNGNYINRDSANATIAGGSGNKIDAKDANSTIAGGYHNNIAEDTAAATIAGGHSNDIGTNSACSAIGGGINNNVKPNTARGTIGGGQDNTISEQGAYSTIGGGASNSIGEDSTHGTVAGGFMNRIGNNSDYSSIGGGHNNTVATNAMYATIPGGSLNFATNHAFATGRRAKARHQGAFVWGDSYNADIASTNVNSVTMRAAGGYRLFSNSGATAGAYLAAGSGSWTSMSDRNAKENLAAVDPLAVLNKVVALPLSTWNYKSQDASVRHLGPMAQDFKAAFDVGESNTGISTVDADGVALAAIQGLNAKVDESRRASEQQIQELEKTVAELKTLVNQLSRTVTE